MAREMKYTEIGEIPVEWELQTFEETFCVLSNNTLPRADLNNRGGTIRNVHYGDILTQFGEVLDCGLDEIPYLNDASLLTASAQVLQDGDVILADTAEDDTVGKATEVYGLGNGRMVAGLHTIPCRVKKGEFAPKWLGYYMNSHTYHDQVLPYITGIKVSSISKTAISETLIAVPPVEEQKAIVSALSEVDQLMAELKKIVAKLQDFKKGCLYMMFPQDGSDIPQMREAEYTDPWEQRKLGEICTVSSGVMGDSLLTEGQYHLTRIETIADGVVDETRVGYLNQQPDERYLLKDGDILYSNINSITHIGKVAKYQGNSVLYHGINLLRLRPNADIDSNFLLYLLNTENRRNWAKTHANQAVSQASINQLLLEFQEITTCKKDEQIRIGTFFRDLDYLITLHQRKINKYMQLKKSMMSELITGKIKLV